MKDKAVNLIRKVLLNRQQADRGRKMGNNGEILNENQAF